MNKEIQEAQGDVEKALALLDSETADGIIAGISLGGEKGPAEYPALIRGTQGAYQMLWSMALGNGMRRSKGTLKMGAQALTILLTLVHYAYALGVRAGRENPPENASG